MIANVSAHRRANAFAQALEEQSDQAAAAEQAEDQADSAGAEQAAQSRMLALASDLGELPRPELDAEVKVVQRAQLVAAMETMLQEGGDPAVPSVPEQRSRKGAHRASPLRKLRPRSRWSKGIAAGGLTVGVAAGAFSGVAAASSDALPGDSLYGLKRGMEDLKLGMADDDSARGAIYLDHASTRLHEARRLMERGRLGPLDHESMSEVRRVLHRMRHDAAEGHRLLHQAYQRDGSIGPIQTLSSFSQSHRSSWSALRHRLPMQLTDVGEEVSSVFDAIEDEVDPLRSMLPKTPSTGKEPDQSDRPGSEATGQDSQLPTSDASSGPTGSEQSKPEPSASDSEEEGLLGGGDGGLFDPPKDEASPSTPEGEDFGKPDITLPPVLPGLLEGFKIEAEDGAE